MFDADHPITRSDEDCLNRTQFANYLARCMLDHHEPESLVVGLYGGWGVGKTSVINLVRAELDFAATNMEDEDKPIILNFSPWSYSGQKQLIYSFFRRLSSVLRDSPYFKNVERDRIIYLLELYVSFFTQKSIPKSLQRPRSLLEKLTSSGYEENYAWESGRDLTLVKAELNELLRKQHHKIIIIIDNISRLYENEIKQIFQIVKSMGDYANTIYLLAFDKEQVVNSINKTDGGGGEEFIEKIVQLPFAIPPIHQADLEMIFARRVNDVIKTVPKEAWNTEYWAEIYYTTIKFFFKNCRDITRYVNTLSFGYSRFRDLVNPVDFFALTAIEVFSPNVYFGIQENKDLFTDLLDHVYVLNQEQMKRDKQRCDEILARNDRLSSELLLELIIHLFPRIRKIYRPQDVFYHSDAIARKLRRICSPDLFDIYFRLSMQLGQVPTSEFETILNIASDPIEFDHALARLNQDERIVKFLDKLDHPPVLQTIPCKHIQAIVNALLDNGDLFPQGTNTLLSLDTPMRIHRIVHGLLRRFDKAEDRFVILQNAIASTNKSLYIMVHELQEQGREHFEESDTYLPLEFRDLLPEQLASLHKLVVSRIENWAANNSLVDHPRLLSILHAWQDWGNESDCKRYVEKIIATDRGLIAFLTAVLDYPITQAMTKYEKKASWEKYIQEFEIFVPIRHLEGHAKALFEDGYFEKLREREQLGLMIFLDLINVPTNKIIPNTTV